jgi:UDP-N-acetylmuramate dehydrogenase
MKDVLVSVRYLDAEGKIVTAPAETLDLSYRHSAFETNGGCVLEAEFRLQSGDPTEIRAKMDDLMGRRRDKQPLDKPSAGSTFKRPQGAFAAALIDQCGLRGYRHGGAAVSDKHCGFVVNEGGASCADVLALCDEVRAIVREKTGYDLEKEIRVVGE